MPAIAALSINDGAETPVAHVFSPVTTDGSKAGWADRAPGIPSGFRTISNDVRAPSGAGAAYRSVWGFNIPVTATVGDVVTVVRNSSAKVELNFSSQSTEQERMDLLAYVRNTLSLTAAEESVKNVEPFY